MLAFAFYTCHSSFFTVRFETRGQRLQGFRGIWSVDWVHEDGMVASCCLTVAIAELSRREKAKDGNGDEGDEAGI